MTLISRLGSLNERLKDLPSRLGDPRIKTVTVTWEGTTLEFLAKVLDVPRQQIGKWVTPSTEIYGDEIVVTDVDRNLDEETLSKGTWSIDGANYLNLYINPNNLITYYVVLREYRDR